MQSFTPVLPSSSQEAFKFQTRHPPAATYGTSLILTLNLDHP